MENFLDPSYNTAFDFQPYLDMVNQLILQAGFKTLVSMVATIAASVLISLWIYINCKTKPGHPFFQFLGLILIPIVVFFALSFLQMRSLSRECDVNDDTIVSIHCIEPNILSQLKNEPSINSDPQALAKIETFGAFQSSGLFLTVMPKSYTISALAFCLLYPFVLLFYTRRRVKD